jgi:hypothetical protein
MSVLMIQAKVRPEAVGDLEAAAREIFAALERTGTDAVRYGSCRKPDGVTYVVLLQVAGGAANPLPGLPEYQRFQAALPGWLDGPPQAGPVEVVGSYRLF